MSLLRRAVRAAALHTEALPDGGWRRCFRFPRESAVFAGHFPGRPVLPAVVQVLMAEDLLAEYVPLFALAGVPQAKFLAPAGPDADMALTVRPGRSAGVWTAELRCGTLVIARFQLEGEAV